MNITEILYHCRCDTLTLHGTSKKILSLQDEISQLKYKQTEHESLVTRIKAEHEEEETKDVWSSCNEEENRDGGATGLQ